MTDDEGVVFRDAVGLAGVGVVHVDAEDLAGKAAEILAGEILVGDAAGVAGGDIEAAVGAELQAAAVVSAVGPFEDDPLAFRVTAHRAAGWDVEARDLRPPGEFPRVVGDVGDVDEAVVGDVRVRGEAVGDDSTRGGAAEHLIEVEQQVGRGRPRVVWEREDPAVALGDEKTVPARGVSDIKWLFELQFREGRLGSVRAGRLRRAADPRCRPRHATGRRGRCGPIPTTLTLAPHGLAGESGQRGGQQDEHQEADSLRHKQPSKRSSCGSSHQLGMRTCLAVAPRPDGFTDLRGDVHVGVAGEAYRWDQCYAVAWVEGSRNFDDSPVGAESGSWLLDRWEHGGVRWARRGSQRAWRTESVSATILRPPERLIFRYGGRDFRLTDVPEQVVRGIPTSASR